MDISMTISKKDSEKISFAVPFFLSFAGIYVPDYGDSLVLIQLLNRFY